RRTPTRTRLPSTPLSRSDRGERVALDQVAGVEEVGSPRVLRPHAVDEGLDQREAIAGRLARVVVVRPDPAVHVGRPEEDELDLRSEEHTSELQSRENLVW